MSPGETGAGPISMHPGRGRGLRMCAPPGSPHQQRCSPTVASENPEVTLPTWGVQLACHTPGSGLLANLQGSLSAGLGLCQRILARDLRTISWFRWSEVPSLSPLPEGVSGPRPPSLRRRGFRTKVLVARLTFILAVRPRSWGAGCAEGKEGSCSDQQGAPDQGP